MSPTGVRIRQGPIPWRGNRFVPARGIRRVRLLTRAAGPDDELSVSILYGDADGQEHPLLDLRADCDAAYIAHAVARGLGLGSPLG